MKTHILLFLSSLLALSMADTKNLAVNLLGIDGGSPNILYNFVASNPAIVKSSQTIKGLSSGESLLSISRYPNSTDFYGVSSTGKVYNLNYTTATATFTSTLSCNVNHSNPTLSTAFDPSDGSLYILTLLSESTTNYFVANPFTGACTSKSTLSYASNAQLSAPSPAGVAFYNGLPYVIDANSNSVLSTISGASLEVVGPLKHDFSGVGGFAIATSSGRYFGLAALYSPYSSSLWAINIHTGYAYQAANLASLTTNLLGFAVLEDATGLDYPFPYLGTSYDPNVQYTQSTGTNSEVEAVFGTYPPSTTTNGNTPSNSGTNTANSGSNTNTPSNTANSGSNTDVASNTANSASNTAGSGSDTAISTSGSNTANSGTNTANSGTNTASGTSGSFTSQFTNAPSGSGVGVVFPVSGNGFTESITYTETIAAYDYRSASESKQAVVVIATNGDAPVAAFSGTVLVGQGSNTVVEEAGIAFPAGVTATVAVNEGSSTVSGVALLKGAAGITVGQLSDVSAGQTEATAVVTVVDGEGRTSTGVATFLLPSEGTNVKLPTVFKAQNNSAGSSVVCVALIVTVLAVFV